MWPNDGPVERSHHEAGHAVARAILGIPFAEVVCNPPQYIIISGPPHPEFVDTNFSAPDSIAEARKLAWRSEAQAFVRRLIISCAAGPVAQMQFERQAAPGDASRFYLFGGSNDAGWIEGHALVLACHHTTSDSEVLDIKWKLVKSAVADAVALVRDYQTVIESVAGELLGRRRLSEAEVKVLIES